jgi:hypothetical protein
MTSEQLDIELLSTFSPLDGLKRDNLTALARKVQIRELSPRRATRRNAPFTSCPGLSNC